MLGNFLSKSMIKFRQSPPCTGSDKCKDLVSLERVILYFWIPFLVASSLTSANFNGKVPRSKPWDCGGFGSY